MENFISVRLGSRASAVACVGAPHAVFTEQIVVFVESSTVTAEDVHELSKGLAAYARPSRVEILKPGEMPLNRVAKTDYLVLSERAKALHSA